MRFLALIRTISGSALVASTVETSLGMARLCLLLCLNWILSDSESDVLRRLSTPTVTSGRFAAVVMTVS